jgi:CRP-like cAMP-binding protein
MPRKAFKAGETTFKTGDNSDLSYRIVLGGVDISVHGQTGEVKIASLEPGDVFEEMGVIDAAPLGQCRYQSIYRLCRLRCR